MESYYSERFLELHSAKFQRWSWSANTSTNYPSTKTPSSPSPLPSHHLCTAAMLWNMWSTLSEKLLNALMIDIWLNKDPHWNFEQHWTNDQRIIGWHGWSHHVCHFLHCTETEDTSRIFGTRGSQSSLWFFTCKHAWRIWWDKHMAQLIHYANQQLRRFL